MITLIARNIKNLMLKDANCAPYSLKKITINLVWAFIFSCIAIPATAQQYHLGDIEIINPWTRATPKGIKVGSGYLYIINHGNTPDRLISVSANKVQTAEIHSMTVVNDIMKMEKMHNGVEIPGNGEVTLKPGGNHIMFMGLSQPFKPGDKISAKLTFEKAGTIDIDFYVNAPGATSPSKLLPSQ
ncbi:copper chaperone PCu(A)C [Bartonella sp. CB175]|uniref:copper chaperone PCu(A)C n=1 Tax=Bartonella sp. CB175 TaxID=3112256 RepID=UPI00300DC70B